MISANAFRNQILLVIGLVFVALFTTTDAAKQHNSKPTPAQVSRAAWVFDPIFKDKWVLATLHKMYPGNKVPPLIRGDKSSYNSAGLASWSCHKDFATLEGTGLTRFEMGMIKLYTAEYPLMYSVLNTALRSQNTVCTNAVKNLTTVMCSAIDKLSTNLEYTEARVLYRAFRYPDRNCDKPTIWSQMEDDEVFTTKSFWSTASNMDQTWRGSQYGRVCWGTRAVHIEIRGTYEPRIPYELANRSDLFEGGEIILKPGTKLKLISKKTLPIEDAGDGWYRVIEKVVFNIVYEKTDLDRIIRMEHKRKIARNS